MEVSGGEVARVLYLHGIAGIGKSALLAVFLERLRATGASVVYLDCRTVEPTERGWLAAAGQVDSVDALLRRLGELPQPVVLALDHYELYRLMDTWLRRVLVPSLPPGGQLVLSGREPPVAGWFADLGGEFRSLPLGPLGDDGARELLGVHGARPVSVARLSRIARGHPLALMLAAAGVAEHPELALEDAATTRVIAELTRLYLEDVPDPGVRRTLEAASVVRRVTEPLLGPCCRRRTSGRPWRACSGCRSSTRAARAWWCTRRCGSRSRDSFTAPTRCGIAATGARPGGSSATR